MTTQGGIQDHVAAARDRLDAHVREIVAWHFDPAMGCDFWLGRAAELGFDPRREVRGYDDLVLFGHFQDEWLRGGPIRRWVPRGLGDQPLYVFETGGTTGLPKCRINVRDFATDYELFSDTLTREFFMPRLLERDEGERAAPCAPFPWTGVANLRPFSRLTQSVTVGVY